MPTTRTVNPDQLTLFMMVYHDALALAVASNPDDYAFGGNEVSGVVEKMRSALERGTYNHAGLSMQLTCLALKIKYTHAGIEAFLTRVTP